MGITRRGFMRDGALALVGTSTIPGFLTRSVFAEAIRASISGKKLVVLFQSGAADGLNIVVPYQEPNYYAMRPSIAIPASRVLDLDGQFGLHPALAAFKPLYDAGHLAIVHACGSPHATRSHFDAQEFMVSGTPGIKSTPDGWLNRALQAGAAPTHPTTVRVPDVAATSAVYPDTSFGNSLRQIAQLLKADLGTKAAFADIGGWDTHQAQGSIDGRLTNRLTEFSNSIAAFWRDLGDQAEDVTIITMSEFGRTAHQNGIGGTDHGHGNVMFVLGGGVRGGKVYGRWPGLANEDLNEGRDLAITTDFRQVLGEVAYKTLGARNLDHIFPNSEMSPSRFLGIV